MMRAYTCQVPGLLASVLICTFAFPVDHYNLGFLQESALRVPWIFIAVALVFFAGSETFRGPRRHVVRFLLYLGAIGIVIALRYLHVRQLPSSSMTDTISLLAPVAMLMLILLVEAGLHLRGRNLLGDFCWGLARVMVYVTTLLLFIETPAQIEHLVTPIDWNGKISVQILYLDAYLIAMIFFDAGIARLTRGGKKYDPSGRFFCWNCGFIIHDRATQRCSECGTNFPSNEVSEYTRPLIGKVGLRLGLLGILIPSGLLLGSILFYVGELALLERTHPGSLDQVLGTLLARVGFAWGFSILLALWIMVAALLFSRKPGRPRYAHLLFLPTIVLLDASFAFFFAAHWVGISCLVLAGLTITLQAVLPLERVDLAAQEEPEHVA